MQVQSVHWPIWLGWALLAVIALAACGPAPTPTALPTTTPAAALRVAADAALAGPLTELGTIYQQAHPGTHVEVSYAADAELAARAQTAEVVIGSPERLADLGGGARLEGKAQLLTTNPVVLVAPNKPDALERSEDLNGRGIKLIVAPDEVPLGAHTSELVEQLRTDAAFGPEFPGRFAESIAQREPSSAKIVERVAQGEADAGFAYSSDAAAAHGLVKTLDLPPGLGVSQLYAVAPIVGSSQSEAARQFVEYVLSPDARALLARYGFAPPP